MKRWIAAVSVLGLAACQQPDDEVAFAPAVTDTGDTAVPLVETRQPFEWTRPSYCDSLPAPPYEPTRIYGFTGAEDFAFDLDGNYVATDDAGNILRIDYDGNSEVWLPNFGFSAGTAFMADGTLAIANVDEGQVKQVHPDGGSNRLIGGLSYPNGVTVDMWGRVYVADQNLGIVQRYDYFWNETVTLADGLFNPNGLTLSPDQSTLYVGSFGGGTIHTVDLNAEFPNATLWAETPRIETETTITEASCMGKAQGDECFFGDDIGVGNCQENTYGGLFCDDTVDTDACTGLYAGDFCTTTALGEVVESVCAERTTTGELFCPRVPGSAVEACVGLDEGDSCYAMGTTRTCRWSWEDILVCDVTRWSDVSEEACVDLYEGDPCIIEDFEGFTAGTCGEGYWGGDITCLPDWYYDYSFEGGLDGVTADACGNIWVTEYTLGYVWRFSPDGQTVDLAVDTGTFWIPNLHFGLGVGGWETDALYIQDRLDDSMLVVYPGTEGGPIPYSPEYQP